MQAPFSEKDTAVFETLLAFSVLTDPRGIQRTGDNRCANHYNGEIEGGTGIFNRGSNPACWEREMMLWKVVTLKLKEKMGRGKVLRKGWRPPPAPAFPEGRNPVLVFFLHGAGTWWTTHKCLHLLFHDPYEQLL